jgi:hypothetical protein
MYSHPRRVYIDETRLASQDCRAGRADGVAGFGDVAVLGRLFAPMSAEALFKA